jgi:hypothetical protein
MRFGVSLHRDFVQTNVLDGGPDDRQTTGLCREDLDLISPLAHIAEKTLNRIGGLNVAVHGLASRHKTSRDAFRPQLGFAPLRDSVACAWRFSAASWVSASCLVGCSQMPMSSA